MFKRLARTIGALALIGLGYVGFLQLRPVPYTVYNWQSEAANFGGFSGVVMTDQGQGIVAISDRGHLYQGRVQRDEGRIVGIEASMQIDAWGDTEGLTLTPDGNLHISYEHTPKIVTFDAGFKAISKTTGPTVLARAHGNKLLEALAHDAGGALYTLTEYAGGDGFDVYRVVGGNWSKAFTLSAHGKYAAVGADIDDRNRFYLLERKVTPLGFRTRLRRWSLIGGQPTNEEILFESLPLELGNLEGVSIWRNQSGDLIATMITDNNLLPLIRSLVVELIIPDTLAPKRNSG